MAVHMSRVGKGHSSWLSQQVSAGRDKPGAALFLVVADTPRFCNIANAESISNLYTTDAILLGTVIPTLLQPEDHGAAMGAKAKPR